MPSMNVSLTPELMQLVQRKVASGMYNNASGFVREAIRNIDTNEQLLYELKLAKLKESLQSGIDDAEKGVFADYSLDGLMQDIDLIRKDQERAAIIANMQARVTEGIHSGVGNNSMDELKDIARKRVLGS